MNEQFLIVIADGIDSTQRMLIHEALVRDTEDWWHQLPNVWIIRSDRSPAAWLESLTVFVPKAPSALLVLQLSNDQKLWGASLPDQTAVEWLATQYSQRPASNVTPRRARFELYQDGRGEYRWRLKAGSGLVIATGGEGYRTRAAALNAIDAVKRDSAISAVTDP